MCFAAPRCADLPELIQLQMVFVGKYDKEFVAAATELMPECGVNRQLIGHLSVRTPAPDVKLNFLKEIAEEHELDWDPTASVTKLLKTHEDLLLLWVNLIMDTLGALALATEPPTYHLMDRNPVHRREPLITNIMWRNLLIQFKQQRC